MKYKHLFFDMDQTIAPARQIIRPEMFSLLNSLSEDIIIVSGQEVDKIKWQSNELPAIILGQNGNHALTKNGQELWNITLTDAELKEIYDHIMKLVSLLPETPNPDWDPIENRGGQVTFSPVGNTAPLEKKMAYDSDRTKRNDLLSKVPFISKDLIVKIGGSTSLDYIHKDRHKGTNVQKLIDLKNWDSKQCVYFGDGLFPGGNDEAVIGVIDTIAVTDESDCLTKLQILLQ